MALKNGDVADLFDLLASLSELDGAIIHKVIAYRRAAEQFRTTAESVERMAAEGRLTDLPGIGATIAAKVDEYRETGTLQALEKLREKYPDGLVAMMREAMTRDFSWGRSGGRYLDLYRRAVTMHHSGRRD